MGAGRTEMMKVCSVSIKRDNEIEIKDKQYL